jgi:hypothetical protein
LHAANIQSVRQATFCPKFVLYDDSAATLLCPAGFDQGRSIPGVRLGEGLALG